MSEVGGDESEVTEAEAERAVVAETGKQKVPALAGGAERGAGDQDLPTGLEADTMDVDTESDLGDARAKVPEGGIERAVGQVARESDVLARRAGNTGEDDLAVGLDRQACGGVVFRTEVGVDDPVGTEVGVEAAVGVVACDREVEVDGVGQREPGDDNLAVRLHRDGVGLSADPEEPGGDNPAGTEVRVGGPVGQVAHNPE